MGIRPSISGNSTGTQTVDHKIGDAYDVVKHVEENLEHVINVSENLGDLTTIITNLPAIDGFVAAVTNGVNDAEAAAALSGSHAAQSEASAAGSVAAKVAAELAETNAETAAATTVTKAAEVAAALIEVEADRIAAAASAAAAEASAVSIATDAAQTAEDRIATAAEAAATELDRIATAADRVATGLDVAAIEADRLATAADRVQTGLDVIAVEADRVAVAEDRAQAGTFADEAAADRTQTGLDRIATGSDKAGTAADRIQTGLDVLATAADRVQTGADVLTTVANTDVSTADKNAAALSADEAEAAAAQAIATKALMDTALAGVTDYSNTLAQLSPAAREVVVAADVVDVFIYDTTLDSDGGAWRKRCNWTSWMKETLGTATRGARNQFPQKALIVARTLSVTIYDLDQASCPMWAVITGKLPSFGSTVVSSVSALNGQIHAGVSAGYAGIFTLDLVANLSSWRGQGQGTNGNGIFVKRDWVSSDTNRFSSANAATFDTYVAGSGLASNTVNDVAVTVLPGTPIDRVRKVPTPTVAVATAGGVSMIHWDGRISSSAATGAHHRVAFDRDFTLWASRVGGYDSSFVTPAEYQLTGWAYNRYDGAPSKPALLGALTTDLSCLKKGEVARGTSLGLSLLKHVPGSGVASLQSNASAVAYLTSKYSTGYMVGDIKLALAESTADLTSLVQGTSEFFVSPELVTDGSFSAGITHVTAARSAVLTWDDTTRLRVEHGGLGEPQGRITLNTIPGVKLKIQLSVFPGAATAVVRVYRSDGATSLYSSAALTTGSYTIYVTPTDNTTYLSLGANTNTLGAHTVFDDVSARHIVTTVLYDDFGGYANDAALQAAWTNPSGFVSTPTLVGGKMRVTAGVDYGRRVYGFTTVIGKRYRISARIDGVAGAAGYISKTNGPSSHSDQGGASSGQVTAGDVSVSFVATAVTSFIACSVRIAGASVDFSNVRVDIAGEDRSVAGNHPLVNGTVTRTAVATGAELAAYGGFSASNYLEVPLSSVIGTGDFCLDFWAYAIDAGSTVDMFVFKNAADETIFHVGKLSSSGPGGVYIRGFNPANTLVASQDESTRDLGSSSFSKVTVVRRSSANAVDIYVDGQFKVTSTDTDWPSMNLSNATKMVIGNDVDANSCGLRLALVRLSATTPTPQQIREMFEAERPLFQTNAKCLLPNDSVTALAYDDSTEVLHVATPSGMARLKDLLVVEKDAIVVTGINAQSGIVATRDAGSADVTQPSLLMRPELLQPALRVPYDRDKVRGSAVTMNATPTVALKLPMDKGEKGQWVIRAKANQYADGAAYASYARQVNAWRPEEGNVGLRGSVSTIGTDIESTGTMDISVTANTTTQTLDVTVTGIASTNLEWELEAIRS